MAKELLEEINKRIELIKYEAEIINDLITVLSDCIEERKDVRTEF